MMRKTKLIQTVLLVVVLLNASVLCNGKMVLGLRKDFIEQFKDKATITTRFHIDALPSKADPHPIDEDGDIHIAGRGSEVGLPLVAEIMNARQEKDSLEFLKDLFKKKAFGKEIELTGVWRIWFEHLSKQQIQDEDFPVPDDSGMAHAFEIHPVTKFGKFTCCLDSFVQIKSATKVFEAKNAVDAFKGIYEKQKAEIIVEGNMVKITASRATHNYVDFVMQLDANPRPVGDGFIVAAKVFEDGNEDSPIILKNRRMVFVKDTEPAKKLNGLKKGARLHVLGIPRVNLHAVSLIVSKLKPNEKYDGDLPYEMIIAAVLPD